jgi:hypothetical protein
MNEKIRTGGAAFPHDGFAISGHESLSQPSNGLTKREMFAAMAMQGHCASSGDCVCPSERLSDINEWRNELAQGAAEYACRIADALLAELEKGQP